MNIPHASEYTVNSSHDRSRSTGYPTINGRPTRTFRDVVSTISRSNISSNSMTQEDWLYLNELHREFHNM